MRKRSVVRIILGVTLTLAALTTSVSPAFAWVGGAGELNVTQTWDGAHVPTLDVEGSDSIENVKQKIQDKTGMSPADMCLTFGVGLDRVLLQDGQVISDYPYIDPGDLIELWRLPVVAAWSITPDEHIVGNAVHNFPVTSSPEATHFAVLDGALPAGVTLDENTGIVDGTFTSADPFDVTIRVTTLCGDADLTWASSGATSLPDTGRDLGAGIAVGVGALAATGIGAALLLRRRATRNER
jgi:LPXTG-motif cell wall-anchored protein